MLFRSVSQSRYINDDEGTHLSGLQRIAESDSDEEGDDMGDEQGNSESDVSPDA